MGVVKITDLTEASAIDVADMMVLVRDPGGSPQTRKMEVRDFLELLLADLVAHSGENTAAGDQLFVMDSGVMKSITLLEFFEAMENVTTTISTMAASDDIPVVSGGVAKHVPFNTLTGPRHIGLPVGATGTSLATGNRQVWFKVPAWLNGWNVTKVEADVVTAPTAASFIAELHNYTSAADITDNPMTIETGETSTDTATTQPSILGTEDDLTTGDLIGVDIDQVGSTEPGEDLLVTVTVELP